jgi:hypothetical protein
MDTHHRSWTYWKCSVAKCPALITTTGDTVNDNFIKQTNNQIHTNCSDVKILCEKALNQMRLRIMNANQIMHDLLIKKKT